MRTIIALWIVGVGSIGAVAAATPTETLSDRSAAGAAAYEQLATAIIAIRASEDSLVAGILGGYLESAEDYLQEAEEDATGRVKHLEAAAAEVTNIANEGDKRVQAIRQRLAKAGHTHNSDADTKEDFMFIDGKEKKEFLAIAKKIAQLGPKATAAQINSVQKELSELFDKSMAAK